MTQTREGPAQETRRKRSKGNAVGSVGSEEDESQGQKWIETNIEKLRGTVPQGDIDNGSRGHMHQHQQRQLTRTMVLARTTTVSGGKGEKIARPGPWHMSRHQHTRKFQRSFMT